MLRRPSLAAALVCAERISRPARGIGAWLIAIVLGSCAAGGAWATILGTSLSWRACPGSASATVFAGFDCDPTGGSVWTLVGAFAIGEPVERAISMDANIDVAFPGLEEVPAFWSFGVDGCNPEGIEMVRGMPPGCDSLTNAFCAGDTTQCDIFYSVTLIPRSNRLRVSMTMATFKPGGVTLPASPQRLFAFAINVPMTGGSSCDGCRMAAAVRWTSGKIYSVDDQGRWLPPITVPSSDPSGFTCASANDKASCAQTPVQRASWGRLKALYR